MYMNLELTSFSPFEIFQTTNKIILRIILVKVVLSLLILIPLQISQIQVKNYLFFCNLSIISYLVLFYI